MVLATNSSGWSNNRLNLGLVSAPRSLGCCSVARKLAIEPAEGIHVRRRDLRTAAPTRCHPYPRRNCCQVRRDEPLRQDQASGKLAVDKKRLRSALRQ